MEGLSEIWIKAMSFRDALAFLGLWLLAGIVSFFAFQGLRALVGKAYRGAAHRRTVRYLINQEPPDFEELARLTKEWRTKDAKGDK